MYLKRDVHIYIHITYDIWIALKWLWIRAVVRGMMGVAKNPHPLLLALRKRDLHNYGINEDYRTKSLLGCRTTTISRTLQDRNRRALRRPRPSRLIRVPVSVRG